MSFEDDTLDPCKETNLKGVVMSQKNKKKSLKESTQKKLNKLWNSGEIFNKKNLKRVTQQKIQQIKEYTRQPIETNYHSICPTALEELAKIHFEGDTRYGTYNWTQGDVIKIKNDAVNHLLAHLVKYMQGDRSELHMAKIMWGAACIIHHDEKCEHQKGINKDENS